MTKTKERMQTKASRRETGARLFLRRHAKGVEVTRGGGHSSNYTNGNVHLSFRTKTTKKNLKKMQKCCCQKRCKKTRKEFAKGWQANKDATRSDATNFSGETWPAFVVQTPQITLPRQPSDRDSAARRRQDIHPHNTARTCLAPRLPPLAHLVLATGAVTRGERLTWEAHRLSGRIMSRCHLCHKSVETKR